MIVYGYRGVKGEVFENILLGFNYVYCYGIWYFELDLVLLKDGVLVMVYDFIVICIISYIGEVSVFIVVELVDMDVWCNISFWFCKIGIFILEDLLD